MSYFKDCVKDHLEYLRHKENNLKIELMKIEAVHAAIKFERENLEAGIQNWTNEENEL